MSDEDIWLPLNEYYCHLHPPSSKETNMPHVGAKNVHTVFIDYIDGAYYYSYEVYVHFSDGVFSPRCATATLWGAKRKARQLIKEHNQSVKRNIAPIRMTDEGKIIN